MNIFHRIAAGGLLVLCGAAGADSATPLVDAFHARAGTTPHLLATAEQVNRAAVDVSNSSDPQARKLFDLMLEQYPILIDELHKSLTKSPPSLSFTERSRLVDTAASYGIARSVLAAGGPIDAAAVSRMRAQAIGVTMDMVDALNRGGNKTAGYVVGQGSEMLPLACAFDWLHDDLSPQQRKQVVDAMIDYSIRPTSEAFFKTRPWWITGMNNWTTINIGGALACGLAIRPEDDPGNVTMCNENGVPEAKPFSQHFESLLKAGLKNLCRPLIQVRANSGLWGEGPGYQHDAMMPLMLLGASVESSLANSADAPPEIAEFLDCLHQTGSLLVQSSIHLASGLPGADVPYSDGTWPFTIEPINFLIADHARGLGNPLWRGAAWQISRRGGKDDLGLFLLYRSRFDWAASTSTATGMKDFDPSTLPTAYYFEGHDHVLPGGSADQMVPLDEVAVWRQNWTNPDAAVLMFKGADNRKPNHSHLDAGTFVYDADQVRWAEQIGRAEGYPLYRDPINPKNYCGYQTYPTRAEGHNTLVLNPTNNDYTAGRVPKAWLAAVNPDQALNDGLSDALATITNLHTDPAQTNFTASVDLTPVYARHGTQKVSRSFDFDRASGAFNIRDEVAFTSNRENELYWFMHVNRNVKCVSNDGTHLLLTQPRADGKIAALKLTLKGNGQFTFGPIQEQLPGGPPTADLLWGYADPKKQQEKFQKISIHLVGLENTANVEVHFEPVNEQPEPGNK